MESFERVTRVQPLKPGVASSSAAGEEALLAALRSGDESAYHELVAAHGGWMLAVARRFLRDEEEARDALREAPRWRYADARRNHGCVRRAR